MLVTFSPIFVADTQIFIDCNFVAPLTRLTTFFLLKLLHTVYKIGMYGLLSILTDSL